MALAESYRLPVTPPHYPPENDQTWTQKAVLATVTTHWHFYKCLGPCSRSRVSVGCPGGGERPLPNSHGVRLKLRQETQVRGCLTLTGPWCVHGAYLCNVRVRMVTFSPIGCGSSNLVTLSNNIYIKKYKKEFIVRIYIDLTGGFFKLTVC